MADVFLSYAREDSARAHTVAEALLGQGLTVFWDMELEPGSTWGDVIGNALESASVVVVLWSRQSVQSVWVRDEAQFGLDRGKLIPVLLEDIDPPMGFRQINAASLVGWNGSPAAREFVALSAALSHFVGRPGEPVASAMSPGEAIEPQLDRRYSTVKGANRTKVFIAHASADKPKLRPILTTLIDIGFALWVDKPQQIGLSREYEERLAKQRIQYGKDWKESIRLAVSKADAVLAFWSDDAVNGRREQFNYEVYMGMMQKKLSQCRLDQVAFTEIGMPYTFDQIADLSEIVEGHYNAELDYLMQDLVKLKSAWWRIW